MATYKVPQDVEAEDKLLGPFSLRQFIFILLFFGTAWVAFLLAQITPPLALATAPFLVAFGTLGFVQRKDQPVEVYLAALIRYYMKPHRRIWDQEGYDQRVIITAPKIIEIIRTKNITQSEVSTRLSSLAKIMDSRGWASKGLDTLPSDRLMTTQAAGPTPDEEPDMMDDRADVSQKFNDLLQKQQETQREAAIERMRNPPPTPPAPTIAQQQVIAVPPGQAMAAAPGEPLPDLHYNPYPNQMHQQVVLPIEEQQRLAAQQAAVVAAQVATTPAEQVQQAPQEPVTPPVSPDTIRLAYNDDLTVSALAREAHQLPTEEVVVSLH
jgi:hypothetical protein